MSGRTAIPGNQVPFVFPACAPCGCMAPLHRLSVASDDMQHPDHYAEQHQEHKSLTHIEPFYFCKVNQIIGAGLEMEPVICSIPLYILLAVPFYKVSSFFLWGFLSLLFVGEYRAKRIVS